jgi:hypothetical protein
MPRTETSLVTIEINKDQLAEVTHMLAYIKDGAATCLMRALNATVKGCKVDAAQAVYAELNVGSARIKADIGLRNATKLILSASVYSKGKKIELIEFGARQVAQGVTFQVRRAGERSQMHYGFIGTGRSTGKQHVMRRDGAMVGKGKPIGVPKSGYLWTFPGRWSSTYRADTKIKYGPSVPDIMGKDAIFKDIETKGTARLEANIDREADSLIRMNQPPGDGTED